MPARIAPRKQRDEVVVVRQDESEAVALPQAESAFTTPPKRPLTRSMAVKERYVALGSTGTGPSVGAGVGPPDPNAEKPGTPVSGMNRKPREGSAFAASSIAWGRVRGCSRTFAQIAPTEGPLSPTNGCQRFLQLRGRGRASRQARPSSERKKHAQRPQTRHRERPVALQRRQDRERHPERHAVRLARRGDRGGQGALQAPCLPRLYPRNYYDRARRSTSSSRRRAHQVENSGRPGRPPRTRERASTASSRRRSACPGPRPSAGSVTGA